MIITVAYIHLKTSMGRKFQKPKLIKSWFYFIENANFPFFGPKFESI